MLEVGLIFDVKIANRKNKIVFNFQSGATVVPRANFDRTEDGTKLRAAMKGFGTDEQAIIDVLTTCSNAQRQQLRQFFTEEYGRVSFLQTLSSSN